MIEIAEHERSQGWNHAAVSTAEATVADTRLNNLAEQQKPARRRWSAAKALLTKAQKAGHAAKIAAARQREIAAYREFDTISRATINEGFGIVAAGNQRWGQRLDHMQRTNAADDAVLTALRKMP
ncbi:hypothetical protein [Nocardia sp. NPDC051832]|uniref:hypothetical protein n=1 Tax=Nocardia sp. NPDC051832 TaxID=3155673 RepID=UPI003413B6D1